MAVGLNVEESASTPLLPPKPKPKRMKTILTFGLLFGAIFVLMILSYWKTSTDLDDYFGITQYHFESMKKKEKEDTTKLRSVQSNMVNQLQKIQKWIKIQDDLSTTTTKSTTSTTTTTTPCTTRFKEVGLGPYPEKSLEPGISWNNSDAVERWNATGPFRKITVKTRKNWYYDPPYEEHINFNTIFEGMILESIDGTVKSFGMDEEYDGGENIKELLIPDGTCIKQVILGSLWYTHQIGFISNKGVRIGHVGSLCGEYDYDDDHYCMDPIRIVPKVYPGTLCLNKIEGVTVETQAAPAITGLKFIFSSGHC